MGGAREIDKYILGDSQTNNVVPVPGPSQNTPEIVSLTSEGNADEEEEKRLALLRQANNKAKVEKARAVIVSLLEKTEENKDARTMFTDVIERVFRYNYDNGNLKTSFVSAPGMYPRPVEVFRECYTSAANVETLNDLMYEANTKREDISDEEVRLVLNADYAKLKEDAEREVRHLCRMSAGGAVWKAKKEYVPPAGFTVWQTGVLQVAESEAARAQRQDVLQQQNPSSSSSASPSTFDFETARNEMLYGRFDPGAVNRDDPRWQLLPEQCDDDDDDDDEADKAGAENSSSNGADCSTAAVVSLQGACASGGAAPNMPVYPPDPFLDLSSAASDVTPAFPQSAAAAAAAAPDMFLQDQDRDSDEENEKKLNQKKRAAADLIANMERLEVLASSEEHKVELDAAATKLQSRYRSSVSKKVVAVKREMVVAAEGIGNSSEENSAARKLQTSYRGRQAKKRVAALKRVKFEEKVGVEKQLILVVHGCGDMPPYDARLNPNTGMCCLRVAMFCIVTAAVAVVAAAAAASHWYIYMNSALAMKNHQFCHYLSEASENHQFCHYLSEASAFSHARLLARLAALVHE